MKKPITETITNTISNARRDMITDENGAELARSVVIVAASKPLLVSWKKVRFSIIRGE
jgi:hypothetical protein